eukprot:gene35236-45630_t
MILGSREYYWNNLVWTAQELDRKAIWLGLAIGFDSGMRISNIVQPEKDREDHCIRAYQVCYKVVDKLDNEQLIPGGLNRAHFSTRSMRQGFASAARAGGMSKSDINSRGGWVPNSVIPENTYTFISNSSGVFGLTSQPVSEGITINDLNLFAPALATKDTSNRRWDV